MENFLVSIIVPTFNRDIETLSRSINSILGQTYDNIEIIIVDDNDEASEIYSENLKYYESIRDNRIKVISNKINRGGAISRNIGVCNANGLFVTFLDDDDVYLPRKIENQVKYMIDQELDMSFSNLILHNDRDVVVDVRNFNFLEFSDNDNLLKYHIMYHLTGTPTFMYLTESFNSVNGFDDVSMGQEYYLMLKTIKSGMKIGYLDKYDVIAYKHRMGGISQGQNKINGEKLLFEKKKEYFHYFSYKEIRYIKFRHRAVLSIAYIRNKKYLRFLMSSCLMVISHPIYTYQGLIDHLKKIVNLKNKTEGNL